jgi:hypothetical protein
MATQDYAASVQGVAIRVTRLSSTGTMLTGVTDSYTTSAFIRTSFTPEYEEGDEITEKSANGSVCVTYKAPDTLKRITMELAICEPDPELTQLLSGGVLLRKNMGTFASQDNQSIGWAGPAVGDDPSGNGVALEVWSYAIKDGKRASTLPYFYWVFPYVLLRASGDRVIENGLLANTFEGYGLGNTGFASGIDGRWEFPAITDRPYSYARAAWAPTGLKGFYTWTQQGTPKTITNKALTTNVATVTVASSTGISTGDTVLVYGVDSTFNGTYTVTATTGTTISYAKTAANVTSTAATGYIQKQAVYTATTGTTGFTAQTSTTAFNVPGNVNYNADNPLDVVVASTQDPSS